MIDSRQFASAWAKLRRAEQHAAELRAQLRKFGRNRDFVIAAEQDPGTHALILRVRVSRRPDLEEWAAILGDAVTNLRSALDHLVWALTVANGNDPPQGVSGPWRRVQFPVVTAQADWPGQAGLGKLWGVNPEFHSLFESFQPFATALGRYQPDRHWLVMLSELSNVDKHRHLNLADMSIHPNDVLRWKHWTRGATLPVPYRLTIDPGVADGFELLRFERDAVEDGLGAIPVVPVDVAFQRGSPGFGREVLQTLFELSEGVLLTLEAFERTAR